VRADAAHPGIVHTELQRHIRWDAEGLPVKSVEQGAATSVLLAASPLVAGVGGRYFEDCAQARVVDRRGPPGTGGVARYAVDPANAERLWDVSLRMAG
jgi:hypothetical protein